MGMSGCRRPVEDLGRKLNLLPSDLDDFFSDTLGRLDGLYFEQAYRSFRVALTADRPLSLLTYSYVLGEDRFDPVSMDVALMADFQPNERCEVMDFRLNSPCRGLMHYHSTRARLRRLPETRRLSPSNPQRLLRIRPSREHVAGSQGASSIRRTLRCDANRAPAGSFLAQFKTIDVDLHDLGEYKYITSEPFDCVRRYETWNTRRQSRSCRHESVCIGNGSSLQSALDKAYQ